MRLLLLNHNLRDHGTYFRAWPIARELAHLGHHTTLLTAAPHHWYRPSETVSDGVRIVETPSWNPLVNPDDGWGPIDIAYRVFRALRERFDIVYAFAHPPNIYLPARIAQIFKRCPLIVDWCDTYRDGIFPLREEIRAYQRASGFRLAAQRVAERAECRLERRILRKADAVTVISRELGRQARALGVPPDRLLHLPSGGDLEVFRPLDKAMCRHELGIEGNGPFIGYIANYNPDERFFLEALARVFRQIPSARLIARCPAFTPQLVKRQGIAPNIVILKRMPFDRLSFVLGASDVLALPLDDNASNRARWPNKFCDYIAAGRPIAATAIGDIADYFPADTLPNRIGAASPCDPEAFAQAILNLIERPTDWEAMGAAARRLAEIRLNWRTLACEVEEFLLKFA